MRRAMIFALAAALLSASPVAAAESGKKSPVNVDWSFGGIFGTYDRAAAQRGFQVFKEVCASCHTAQYLSFRHLDGIGLNEEEIKAIAAGYEVADGPDAEGNMFRRPGKPFDALPAPFANEQAARAVNNGALPVDLSLITKARPNGANYVYSVLTGYGHAPAGMTMAEGMYYNPFFANSQIAMPPPLTDGQVTFADNTAATTAQMAQDVVMFLAWLSEPKMEERKQTGIKVILFLIVMTGVLFAAKRRIWADVHD